MAERRMFNKTLMASNLFSLLPHSVQVLYLHLNLQADDDGVCANSNAVCRICKCTKKHMQMLIDGGWLLPFEQEIVVITHWLIHNQIRRDRYKPSLYRQVTGRIQKGADGRYVVIPEGNQTSTDPAPQLSSDQLSPDQSSIDQIRQEEVIAADPVAPSSLAASAAGSDDIEKACQDILRYYQCLCQNLQPCDGLTPKIRERIAYCCREGITPLHLISTFCEANRSAFLQGDNRQGWRASLEWLLDPERIREVDAGKYATWL